MKNIQPILDELYAIDPELRAHEEKLKKIISRLLQSQPDTKFDKRFAKRLRAELVTGEQDTADSWLTTLMNNKLSYAIGGAVLATLLIAPTIYFSQTQTGTTLVSRSEVSGITILKDNAFGSLLAQNTGELDENAPAATPVATGLGGGGANAARPQSGGGGDMAMIADIEGKMIAPGEPYPYQITEYRYVGEDITLEQTAMEVFKRDTSALRKIALAQSLGNLNLGIADLSSFGRNAVRHINFGDGQGSFNGSIDLINGTISLNKEEFIAYDESSRMRLDQVPSDDQLIAAADRFMRQHGISLEGYGEAEVRDDWRTFYEQSTDKQGFYIPDTSQVIYPLEINGVPVYDQGGMADGIQVSINNRTREVNGIWNITIQNYQASKYAVETDIQSILDVINTRNSEFLPPNAIIQTTTIELGTPEVALVKVWHWNGNEGQELLAPAYRFPILNKPADQPWFQDALVVPIASELLQAQYGYGGVSPRPLPVEPLVDPAVSVTPPAPEVMIEEIAQ